MHFWPKYDNSIDALFWVQTAENGHVLKIGLFDYAESQETNTGD